MSKVYHLRTVQVIPCTLEKAWAFFSNPANLAEITPDNLRFKILSAGEKEMHPGQIIEYHVHPVLNIPLYWMTEITHVQHLKYFVDEQRFGPYSLWHHQHHFKEIPGGVEMTDIVHYKLPFWFFGDIANAMFVKKQLKDIFDYRTKRVNALFGKV